MTVSILICEARHAAIPRPDGEEPAAMIASTIAGVQEGVRVVSADLPPKSDAQAAADVSPGR
jgi:hypothetical protein